MGDLEITQCSLLSGCTMDGDEDGVCYVGKDAEKLDANVHNGGPGECGADSLYSGS